MTMKQKDDDDEEQHGEDEDEEDECQGGGQAQEFSDPFFESFDRVPSGISFDADLPSSDSDDDDDDDDDVRISFASAMAPPSFRRLNDFDGINLPDINEEDEHEDTDANGFDYGIWMAEPISVKDRRRKLLQGLGLTSSKNLPAVPIASSRRIPPNILLAHSNSRLPSSRFTAAAAAIAAAAPALAAPALAAPINPAPSPPKIPKRSRSDSELAFPSPPSLFRVSSAPPSQWRSWARNGTEQQGSNEENTEDHGVLRIKNLDTGKEFVVSKLDEFDHSLGSSPIVKEVMRRVTSDASATAIVAASTLKSLSSKSTRNIKSSKKKVNWLKNIKFMASTMLMSEKEKEASKDKSNSSERLKVHQSGKSYKELTGLYMCQEIQAHQGSIWTMKFSCDSRYLASAGEDRVVHIWQVLECDSLTSSLHRQKQPPSPSKKPPLANGGSSLLSRSNRSGGQVSKRTKKGKGSGIPDYIVLPETIFSLSAEPFCSLEGHLDDILDLSWSKSQHLLSSSMDKTVRLWDIETKTCLKLFAHNDYVTCIQFNPTDERYFISGSLDAKVRIWSIPNRLVVDWSDLHEMVTATCYTPDGQGALVGSHKGSCRFYNTSDAKLSQEGQIDIRTKKKKSGAKKITGFQFAPDNPSEVLITSADSRIRVFDGVDMIHKFRGFRNTSSQISASCTMDGKYVVCASEDSHVYIWKRDRPRGKGRATTRSQEHFYCKDVSIAIPWPNGGSNCVPSPDLPSWSRTNNHRTPSNLEDMFPSSRSHNCPSTPKKSSENTSPSPEEIHSSPRAGSAIGSSALVLASASLRSGHAAGSSISSSVTSSSSSSFSSWGWSVGNNNKITSSMEAANAWGLVVVTAGLGGNIKVYQNFGLPLRLRGQPNLF